MSREQIMPAPDLTAVEFSPPTLLNPNHTLAHNLQAAEEITIYDYDYD